MKMDVPASSIIEIGLKGLKMNEHWKEWLNNKIYLLSTPTGALVGGASFLLGILIGRLFINMMKGI
tara:strand:- start:1558 stop:1755 length:198 start_codon:yes stop_codon:yes gene_type:complete